MKTSLSRTLLVSLILFFADMDETFGANNQLFVIDRSLDKNQIYYILNVDAKNRLNEDAPITIYWLKRVDGNKTQSLSWMQSHYGYGLKYISKNSASAIFQFAAYNKRTFELRKDQSGQFRVFTQTGKGEIVVNRIFVHNNGGTFMKPKISAVDIYGTNLKTGELVVETTKF
ncbi:MAG: DUF4833 domain-containing protein [Bacteroidales bacterium]